MDRDALERWVEGYEQMWRTAGTDGLPALFADDVTYSPSPWAEPVVGLEALADFWEAERDSPDEAFTMDGEVVAIDGDTGVVRVEVHYQATGDRWRDLWVVTVGHDGRATGFEEWPFAPDQPDGH